MFMYKCVNSLQSSNLRRPINANVQEVLKGFDPPLLKFTQTMWSVKHNSLPDKIKVKLFVQVNSSE